MMRTSRSTIIPHSHHGIADTAVNEKVNTHIRIYVGGKKRCIGLIHSNSMTSMAREIVKIKSKYSYSDEENWTTV